MSQERTEFSVGESAEIRKTITESDIDDFARLTGDTNPIHLDEAYARETRFKGRIAHGMLGAGLISAVLGTKLPGSGAIYLSQSLRFKAPVRPGDTITARATVAEWNGDKGTVKLTTEAVNQDGVVVITGEAALIMSRFLKG